MPSFNPDRLDLARRRRGYTKVELAGAVGVNRRVFTDYEAGKYEPSDETLTKLAEVLSFPAEFFFGPSLEEPPQNGASFRALSSATMKLQARALASGTRARALYDWIDTRFTLPDPSIPRYATLDPEAAAVAVRTEWQLGERPIGNMIHLLEAHGVRVFSLAEDSRLMDAFSFWRGELPYVFLNTIKSAEHSRMDAAHELGHLVLHGKHGAVQRQKEIEQEAQRFASALLMPAGSVVAETAHAYSLHQLVQLKRRWNVALAALTYRMHQLDVLSDWHYRALFADIARHGYRTKEPNPCQSEASQVLAKVFRSLRDTGLTMRDIARDLLIYPDELAKMIFGLVMTALDGAGLSTRTTSPRPDWAMPYLERA